MLLAKHACLASCVEKDEDVRAQRSWRYTYVKMKMNEKYIVPLPV